MEKSLLDKWQAKWESSTKGRTTFEFLPSVSGKEKDNQCVDEEEKRGTFCYFIPGLMTEESRVICIVGYVQIPIPSRNTFFRYLYIELLHQGTDEIQRVTLEEYE